MRFLVVSYFYPPFPQAGGNRWLSMARWLRAAGHEVTIVTTTAHGALPTDAADRVVRAGDLASAGVLRRALRRPEATSADAVAAPAPALLTQVVVPDSHLVSWAPSAWRAVRRLARGTDVLVTSGPPESAHLIGLALGARRPAIWLADFRDGWVFEPPRAPFPTRGQRALERALEARVVRGADAVLTATRPVADDFHARYGIDATWVPNGCDPGLEPEVGAGAPDPVTLVHTGTLSGAWGRDPGPLLRALAAVAADGVALRLVLAGRREPAVDALVAATGAPVEHLGLLSRADALTLQRRAGTLLLLTSPNAGEATGKLFEYLAAGRPILALARGSEAGRIVEETGTGEVAEAGDEAAIAAALRRAAVGALPYAPRGLERFTYPGPAETVAGLAGRLAAAGSGGF